MKILQLKETWTEYPVNFHWMNLAELKRSGQRYNLPDFGGTNSVISQLSIMLNVYLRTTLGLTPLY